MPLQERNQALLEAVRHSGTVLVNKRSDNLAVGSEVMLQYVGYKTADCNACSVLILEKSSYCLQTFQMLRTDINNTNSFWWVWCLQEYIGILLFLDCEFWSWDAFSRRRFIVIGEMRHDGFVSRKEVIRGERDGFNLLCHSVVGFEGEEMVGNICHDVPTTAEIEITVRRR